MPFTSTWMQLKIATPRESERERQIPHGITCTWNLKYDTNEPIYEAEAERNLENTLVVARRQGLREGMDWG